MRALSRSWDAVYDAYRALFLGAVGSKHAISETLALSTPLIFCGLSVAFAFKGGLFNIGGNGQLIAGATLATWLAITFDLPAPIHVVVCLIGAFVGGAIWGGIAGVLRATTGAHEVITTIMLNFIALRFLDYLLTLEAFLPEGQANPVSEPLPDSARLTRFPGASDSTWASSWPSSPWWWCGGSCDGRPGGSRSRRSGSTPTPPATPGCAPACSSW